jgi:hypothetical protein
MPRLLSIAFLINETVLALMLLHLPDFASEIGGLYASDFLAPECLQSVVDYVHYLKRTQDLTPMY